MLDLGLFERRGKKILGTTPAKSILERSFSSKSTQTRESPAGVRSPRIQAQWLIALFQLS